MSDEKKSVIGFAEEGAILLDKALGMACMLQSAEGNGDLEWTFISASLSRYLMQMENLIRSAKKLFEELPKLENGGEGRAA